jgi:hypothetical protein
MQIDLSRGCAIETYLKLRRYIVMIPLERKLRHYEETNEIDNNVLKLVYIFLVRNGYERVLIKVELR